MARPVRASSAEILPALPRGLERQAGFSLLELLIAISILGLIVAQMSVAVVSQDRTQRSHTRDIQTLDVTRHALDVMASDTRNAGFMIPRWAAVATGDGGNNAADRLCVSDSTYFDLPAPGSAAPSSLDLRTDRFTGAPVSAWSSTQITLTTLDIDQFGGVNDFVVGQGVIIAQSDGGPNAPLPAKGLGTHCARIQGIVVGGAPVITLVHPISGATFTGTANLIAVPAHVYELDPTGLMRNGTVLTDLIEDLQIEYWVDVLNGGPNGIEDNNEFPIHDINAMPLAVRDSARIRRVRITMVGRAAQTDETTSVQNRPAIANRVQGPPDGFSRKILTTSVLPRNLLEPGAIANVP